MDSICDWLRYMLKRRLTTYWHKLTSKGGQFTPQIQCEYVYLGTKYGGWAICPEQLPPEAIVYSFGIGEDISFDLALAEQFDVEIYAFDPTPRAIEWVNKQHLPEKFHVLDYGLEALDGVTTFYPPENPAYVSHTTLARPQTAEQAIEVTMKRLSTIMQALGHTHVDILKMDIEGSEYDVIEEITPFLSESSVFVGQILVEFHPQFIDDGVKKTMKSVKLLNDLGYKIFYVAPNTNELSFVYVG